MQGIEEQVNIMPKGNTVELNPGSLGRGSQTPFPTPVSVSRLYQGGGQEVKERVVVVFPSTWAANEASSAAGGT